MDERQARNTKIWTELCKDGNDELLTKVIMSLPLPDRLWVDANMGHRRMENLIQQIELSPREIAVLEGMADGLINEEIAEREQRGVETVKSQIRAIIKKLNAKNRTHAVSIAFREGIIE